MSETHSTDSLFSIANEGTTVTVENDNYDDVEDGEQLPFTLNTHTVFELLKPGNFVGLRSPQKSIEMFFICEVIDKGVASENLTDAYGHRILASERYAEIKYLEK